MLKRAKYIKKKNREYNTPMFRTPSGELIPLKEDPLRNPAELFELQNRYFKGRRET
ncbi:MAG: hypothetical protein WDA47_04180 [Bacilli bacterium]|jgi:hypothetical protein